MVYRFEIEIEYPHLDEEQARRVVEKLLTANFEDVKVTTTETIKKEKRNG